MDRIFAAPSGERIHICHECNKHGVWEDTWRWYGSLKDLDDGTVTKFCSEECAVAWAKRTRVRSSDGSTPQNPLWPYGSEEREEKPSK